MNRVMLREVPLPIVLALRQEVLYPEQSLEENRLADDDRGVHWGVYLGDEPISVISLFGRGDVWQFRKFATRLTYQGRGYGSRLLEHVLDLVTAAGGKTLWCNARVTAKGLYERYGMTAVGEPWQNVGHTYIKMEKQLCRSSQP